MPQVKRTDDESESIATSLRRYRETDGPLIEHYRNAAYYTLGAALQPGGLLELVEEIVGAKETSRYAVA